LVRIAGPDPPPTYIQALYAQISYNIYNYLLIIYILYICEI